MVELRANGLKHSWHIVITPDFVTNISLLTFPYTWTPLQLRRTF